MSLKITLRQNNIKSNKSYKKWFAQPVHNEEIHTADIAERIQKNSSFSKGSVVGVIDDFIQEMIISMHDSHTVVIDGLGRFDLTVESEGVDNPQSFRIDRDVKKVKCRFLPAGKRNIDGRVTSKLSENVEVEWLSENK